MTESAIPLQPQATAVGSGGGSGASGGGNASNYEVHLNNSPDDEPLRAKIPVEDEWIGKHPDGFADGFSDRGIQGRGGSSRVFYSEQERTITTQSGETITTLCGRIRGYLVTPLTFIVAHQRHNRIMNPPQTTDDDNTQKPACCSWCSSHVTHGDAGDWNLVQQLLNLELAELISLDGMEMRLSDLTICKNGHFEMWVDPESKGPIGISAEVQAGLSSRATHMLQSHKVYFAALFYSMIVRKSVWESQEAKCDYQLKRAMSYIYAGKPKEAVQDCTACLEIYPQLQSAHHCRAMAYSQLQSYQEAYKDCQTAHALQPSADTQKMLTELQTMLGIQQAPTQGMQGQQPQQEHQQQEQQQQQQLQQQPVPQQFPVQPVSGSSAPQQQQQTQQLIRPPQQHPTPQNDQEEEEGDEDEEEEATFSCPICNQPDDEQMVACDRCNKWYHYPTCTEYDTKTPEHARWFCEDCRYLSDPWVESGPQKKKRKKSPDGV